MLEPSKPLTGFQVLTLAYNLPGPIAAQRLAGLGATLTKVEPPGGDPFAPWCPAWYEALCKGHRVLRLDLKSVAGRAEMETLLAQADLFLTSLRPAALARWSLDAAAVQDRHPRLCQVAIVGFPAPGQNRSGHDLTYQAEAGLLDPPQLPRTLLADLAGAERAASQALALLLARERGLGAGWCEVALADGAAAFAEPLRHGLTLPGGLLGGGLERYGIYATRQGWVAVAALEPHFWERLEAALGAGEGVLSAAALGPILLGRSAEEWAAWAAERDLPIVAVRDPGKGG